MTGASFSTTRLILPSSSIRPDLVCSRPAVSTTTVSTSPSVPVRDRLERDRRGVAALATAHGEHPDPLAPRLELVGGRGAEGVRGTEDDAPAVTDEHAGDLADGRRLARPVDADDEDDAGQPVVPVDMEGAVEVGPEDGDQLPHQQLPEVLPRCGGQHHRLGAQPLDDLGRRGDADVGGQEGLLELLPVVLGELLAGEDGEQPAAERGLRAGQPRPQPDQPAGRRRRASRRPGPAPARPGAARPRGSGARRPSPRRPTARVEPGTRAAGAG